MSPALTLPQCHVATLLGWAVLSARSGHADIASMWVERAGLMVSKLQRRNRFAASQLVNAMGKALRGRVEAESATRWAYFDATLQGGQS